MSTGLMRTGFMRAVFVGMNLIVWKVRYSIHKTELGRPLSSIARRTLDAGKETGSNPKLLIRRDCRLMPCIDFDNSRNSASVSPGSLCDVETSSIEVKDCSGSIS